MLENLKKQVFQANLDLVKHQLVVLTWGNVSAIDRKTNLVVIKPSGINYENMKIDDMVVVDLNGNIVEGNLRPSSDTKTHLEIYKAFEGVNSIVHTHSKFATIFAQAKKEIKPFGTTHADYFYHNIMVTRPLKNEEINEDYELNTGKVIVEKFKNEKVNPLECPAILVSEHGPFTFGQTVENALENSIVLEFISEMAIHTINLKQSELPMQNSLIKKHYYRKHGKNAYYGQK
jgi:L-ribulose-5-phosphate 4-epimerase